MSTSNKSGEGVKLVLLGGALVLPSLLLVSLGLLQSGFGINLTDRIPRVVQGALFHPVVLLGGLFAGFITCLPSVFHLRWHDDTGSLTCTVRVKGRLLQVGLIVLSCVLTSAIFTYAFVENFRVVGR